MTIADLLTSAARADPSRPVVTFYDLETGERTELSLTTTMNWVAKTANMLQDTLGADDESTVGVLLPIHWETVVWLLAVWVVGSAVSLEPGHPVVVVDPETLEVAGDADDIVALSLRPLGGRFTSPLPPGVIDYNADVGGHGDRFTAYYPPRSSSVAVRDADGIVTHADLVADSADRYPDGARVLLVGDRDTAALMPAILGALHAKGSLVLVRSRSPESDADRIAAIAETERVTVG
ncbi:TIGR03089 family protein [Mumia sp. zg.B17]|uniref:TIGR03089 family protein n=1 Tax=Mumia sp. zg.B17 TaxID=2855446 RepID=UPI001C6E3ED5|nr:TIGR03089 family protein [Mumia sp. zg.B17]MBW9204870.1 TIGR03089 family protein [Mumia sp. zg.B17]